MDPQSQSFTPYSSNSETWRLHEDVARLQEVQAEHSDRLTKLERDARTKNVWANNSAFPGVLSGTPQQGEPGLVSATSTKVNVSSSIAPAAAG